MEIVNDRRLGRGACTEELLLGNSGIIEINASEHIGHYGQVAPSGQIRRALDRVATRRPGESEFESSRCGPLRRNQSKRRRISEHVDALALERGDRLSQITGSQKLGQNERGERIPIE